MTINVVDSQKMSLFSVAMQGNHGVLRRHGDSHGTVFTHRSREVTFGVVQCSVKVMIKVCVVVKVIVTTAPLSAGV